MGREGGEGGNVIGGGGGGGSGVDGGGAMGKLSEAQLPPDKRKKEKRF